MKDKEQKKHWQVRLNAEQIFELKYLLRNEINNEQDNDESLLTLLRSIIHAFDEAGQLELVECLECMHVYPEIDHDLKPCPTCRNIKAERTIYLGIE
jgi:hypothetical protein